MLISRSLLASRRQGQPNLYLSPMASSPPLTLIALPELPVGPMAPAGDLLVPQALWPPQILGDESTLGHYASPPQIPSSNFILNHFTATAVGSSSRTPSENDHLAKTKSRPFNSNIPWSVLTLEGLFSFTPSTGEVSFRPKTSRLNAVEVSFTSPYLSSSSSSSSSFSSLPFSLSSSSSLSSTFNSDPLTSTDQDPVWEAEVPEGRFRVYPNLGYFFFLCHRSHPLCPSGLYGFGDFEDIQDHPRCSPSHWRRGKVSFWNRRSMMRDSILRRLKTKTSQEEKAGELYTSVAHGKRKAPCAPSKKRRRRCPSLSSSSSSESESDSPSEFKSESKPEPASGSKSISEAPYFGIEGQEPHHML